MANRKLPLKQSTVDFVEYYKMLSAKVVVEENRLEVYKEEYLSIEASIEPERAMEKDVQIRNQVAFINKIKGKKQELANVMLNYGRTLDDNEAAVFSLAVLQGKPIKDVSRKLGISYSSVNQIKIKLKKELNKKIDFRDDL